MPFKVIMLKGTHMISPFHSLVLECNNKQNPKSHPQTNSQTVYAPPQKFVPSHPPNK